MPNKERTLEYSDSAGIIKKELKKKKSLRCSLTLYVLRKQDFWPSSLKASKTGISDGNCSVRSMKWQTLHKYTVRNLPVNTEDFRSCSLEQSSRTTLFQSHKPLQQHSVLCYILAGWVVKGFVLSLAANELIPHVFKALTVEKKASVISVEDHVLLFTQTQEASLVFLKSLVSPIAWMRSH